MIKENPPVILTQDKITVTKNVVVSHPVIRSAPKPKEVMEGTTWQVTITPISGGAQEIDTITFIQQKFVSQKLSQKKFDTSNYSLRKEGDGKTIWETMQTSP